jgi:hypothetical protein
MEETWVEMKEKEEEDTEDTVYLSEIRWEFEGIPQCNVLHFVRQKRIVCIVKFWGKRWVVVDMWEVGGVLFVLGEWGGGEKRKVRVVEREVKCTLKGVCFGLLIAMLCLFCFWFSQYEVPCWWKKKKEIMMGDESVRVGEMKDEEEE